MLTHTAMRAEQFNWNTALLGHTSCACAKPFSQPTARFLFFYSLQCSAHTTDFISVINPFLNWCYLWQRGSLLRSLCVDISIQTRSSEWVMTGTDKRAVNISWREINKTPTPSSSSPLGSGSTGIWLLGNTDQTSPTSQRSFLRGHTILAAGFKA